MRFEKTFVPYGAYWSSPFCKWQGSFSNLNSVHLAAQVARRALEDREISAEGFHSMVLGMTVPQKSTLYGAPWLAALIGAERISGTMVSQACATGARVLATAAAEVECSGERTLLTITTDRCSNGPHIYYPNPTGPGGTGDKEDWVWDSFGCDPWAKNSMIETAENVARDARITREEQDAVTLTRYQQFRMATDDDHAFQRRYMVRPCEVKDARQKKVIATVAGDEGIFATTEEGLRGLRPVLTKGTVTFGTQTHPADGTCGMVICDRSRARELSRDASIEVQPIAYAESRVKKGYMARATVPAARQALAEAGLSIDKIDVIKTHNPFAVNDIFFAREMGVAIDAFNNYGSSLVYGHPQGPTGTRLLMETVEELALRGGGYGLFVGCAAGDTAAAVILRVGR